MSPSHAQLMARDQSFERLYRRHRRDVYGAVLRDVRDPDEAEDVTQIAFLNAFRAIRRGEEPEKPRAWLVTIARNVVKRRYKTQALRPQEVSLDPEAAADLMDLEGPTVGEIAAAIRSLPPNQRAVILLREIQGRSYAEIAEELDLSVAAVETLIFRARRSLSDRLKLIDQVPTTQEKRRLRGLLALPLPGLGKFSFGFSAGRAAVAAFVGGVTIVTVPMTDVPAGPPNHSVVQRAPSIAERVGPSVATAPAFEAKPATDAGHKRDRSKTGASAPPPADSGGIGGAQDLVPSVEAPLPVPSLPQQTLPSVTLPPLPVEPPTLTLPPPPDTGVLG